MEKHLANIVYVLVLNLILVLQRQEHKKTRFIFGRSSNKKPTISTKYEWLKYSNTSDFKKINKQDNLTVNVLSDIYEILMA